MEETYNLERFLAAQNYKGTYEQALQEIKNGSSINETAFGGRRTLRSPDKKMEP